jgi:DNA modification methylase
MWLDCCTQEAIAEALEVSQPTVSGIIKKRKSAEFDNPPGRTDKNPWGAVQHFDVWQFATADKEDRQQSYFGALPPQVIQNLLWFHTEPGDVVVDLFAGSGTTVNVAKEMARRIWAADIRGNHYSPHLPIHRHDATTGWPSDAPAKADLVFLDPPYWKQAEGRYSSEPNELAEMDLDAFYKAWAGIVAACVKHAKRIAYIISPTQNEDGSVVDHAVDMLSPFWEASWSVQRRYIVPYPTQQATGQQVTWARENKRMLKLYRDLVVVRP